MAKWTRNSHRDAFINALATDSIRSCDIASRLKFNFSYFDGSQEPGLDIADFDNLFAVGLIDKMKAFSRSPLSYWQKERVGAGGLKVLEIYGKFPTRSEFTHPKHVPHDVLWGRFRLDNMARLIGFVLPAEYSNTACEKHKFNYDCNTFYVVFVDLEHKFYCVENR
ncbi:MAG: hypothetical protein U1A62_07410 [Pseudomonas sp.]|nr:hypothetical protein [Pseudomonas sp.]